MEVSAADLDEESIPDHFRFFVRVVDAGGEVLECGRDLAAIQARLGARARRQFMAGQGARFTQDDETDWAFGELKTTLLMAGGATAWPALVDQGSSVGMRLFDTWDEAAQSHAEGVVRLVSIRLSDKLKYLARNHDISREALLAWSSIDSAERLVADLIHRSLVDCAGDVSNIRNPESFEALCQSVRAGIGDVLLARAALLDEFLQIYGRLAPRINQGMESTLSDVFNDIATQLEDLVYPGFLTELESGRLQHYPRYIRAIEERMAQLDLNPARDHQRMAQVETWWNRYLGALEAGRPYDENLDSFRWLLEEYRVSLFAQRLGTATKVSEKRLAEAWEKTGC
jgi:ATP-dependent helicase HrpA